MPTALFSIHTNVLTQLIIIENIRRRSFFVFFLLFFFKWKDETHRSYKVNQDSQLSLVELQPNRDGLVTEPVFLAIFKKMWFCQLLAMSAQKAAS